MAACSLQLRTATFEPAIYPSVGAPPSESVKVHQCIGIRQDDYSQVSHLEIISISISYASYQALQQSMDLDEHNAWRSDLASI
jgi:hypothetical protein